MSPSFQIITLFLLEMFELNFNCGVIMINEYLPPQIIPLQQISSRAAVSSARLSSAASHGASNKAGLQLQTANSLFFPSGSSIHKSFTFYFLACMIHLADRLINCYRPRELQHKGAPRCLFTPACCSWRQFERHAGSIDQMMLTISFLSTTKVSKRLMVDHPGCGSAVSLSLNKSLNSFSFVLWVLLQHTLLVAMTQFYVLLIISFIIIVYNLHFEPTR